jgi:hypothetical protein
MGQTSPTFSDAPPTLLIRFCVERNRPTSRWSNRVPPTLLARADEVIE